MYFLYVVSILVFAVSIYYIVEKRNDTKEDFANTCKNHLLNFGNLEIYVINLDRNKDRLENFIEQYISSDLRYKQFNRFSAIEGKKLDIEDYVTDKAYKEIKDAEDNGFRTKHYQLTRGAVGCYLSHKNVYKKIMQQNAPYAIVFEDDVDIDRNILAKVNNALTTIPQDWDILLLGCFCIKCNKKSIYMDVDRFFLLHGYIIRKDSAETIYKYLDNKKIEQQIDWELSDMINQINLKVYCLKDSIAKQKGFKTNIQTPLKIIPGINPYATV